MRQSAERQLQEMGGAHPSHHVRLFAAGIGRAVRARLRQLRRPRGSRRSNGPGRDRHRVRGRIGTVDDRRVPGSARAIVQSRCTLRRPAVREARWRSWPPRTTPRPPQHIEQLRRVPASGRLPNRRPLVRISLRSVSLNFGATTARLVVRCLAVFEGRSVPASGFRFFGGHCCRPEAVPTARIRCRRRVRPPERLAARQVSISSASK